MTPSLLEPLKIREFRLFWIGTTTSLIGDQLSFVAMPWLVLKLTGDPLAMGSVIAVAAVPRAVFMLLGGALTDRFSPRIVMLLSNLVRLVSVLVLAALIYQQLIEMWMIFSIAFVFGLADAFMFPAASAYPPRLLEPEKLAAGNSLLQGMAQLTLVIGPMVAGILIATIGSGGGELQDREGLAFVFMLDSITFLAPIAILLVIRDRFPPQVNEQDDIWASLKVGLKHVWDDKPLRMFVFMVGGLTLVFRGPFSVGVPAFADGFLTEGAAGFGTILSALGVGAIIGTVIAGSTRLPRGNRIGILLLVDFLGFGIVLAAMTFVRELWIIAAMVLVGGILDGYIIIFIITWVQKRVPTHLMGRVMSVVMFFSQGMFPISAAIAGVAAGIDLAMMLLVSGLLMIFVAAVGLLFRPLRRLGYD